MSQKNLPPLGVGEAYLATDFENFELVAAGVVGPKAILRLHLKNKTTIDLPASDRELKGLTETLCDFFPKIAAEQLRFRGRLK